MNSGLKLCWSAAWIGAVLLGPSCAGRRALTDSPTPGASGAGIYKARVSDEQGHSRRFRLMVYAALPDRLHAEVLSPLGGTELIIDGGAGRLALSVVSQRVAFVGRSDSEVLERIVGTPISLEDLVRALLTGEHGGGGYRVQRWAAESPGLPERFEIGSEGRHLRLELKRLGNMRETPSRLATGEPVEGFERRSLDDFDWDWFGEGEAPQPAGG